MGSKLNILQLMDSFNQGGTERQAVQLTRLLHSTGRYNLNVACLDSSGPLRQEILDLGINDIPEFPLTSFYDRTALWQWRRFARFCHQREIDLVQVHDFYTNIFGMFGAVLARVPIRIAARRETDPFRSSAQRFVERRSYNLAHSIVANAEAVKEKLISEGVKADNIVTIHNGLDCARVKPLSNASRSEMLNSLGLPSRGNLSFVTLVANMRQPEGGPKAYKDHPTFLRAAKQIIEAVPSAAFVLAGEGELVPGLKALAASLGIGERAFFTGRCARVADLLSISDVCVLSSSSSEGFSNSIIEYMAAARPVVATDVGGAREQVVHGETGFLVPSGDHGSLAKYVIGLLSNSEWARTMGERGLDRVKQKFSLEKQLAKTEELYERLVVQLLDR
jgi:glycosyltransferase involved in cell wall biosynthesis